MKSKNHRLYIVGCGIKFLSHLTLEVKALIESCDAVFYLVNDPAMKRWIEESNPNAKSLDFLYFGSSERDAAYNKICSELVKHAECNRNTCLVTYGHPLLLSDFSQKIIKEIECGHNDIDLRILPGISSLDSLCCDLNIDLSMGGVQAYESTEFIKNNYKINKSSHVVLWQIGVAGITKIIDDEGLLGCSERDIALRALKNKLINIYGEQKTIIIYVAAMYQSISPVIIKSVLADIDKISIPRLATAYIPPSN